MTKYFFKEQEITKELINLVSICISSKTNHQLSDTLVTQNKILNIFYCEEALIQEYLISTAIKLRMIDDQFRAQGKIFNVDKVGTLRTGSTNIDLDLREACNKTIHAVKFVPQIRKKRGGKRYYIPKVKLHGERDHNPWEASLDIKQYFLTGLKLIKEYEEDWPVSSR